MRRRWALPTLQAELILGTASGISLESFVWETVSSIRKPGNLV